jgi:hypothetical protein
MLEDSISKEDLQVVSGKAQTYESFGRSLVAAVIATAADQIREPIGVGNAIQLEGVTVNVTVLPGGLVWACVGLPGFGNVCKLERPERD